MNRADQKYEGLGRFGQCSIVGLGNQGTWLVKVLLKVFVTFYTMIATVRQHNIPVRCECYSLRSIYLASRGVNEGEE